MTLCRCHQINLHRIKSVCRQILGALLYLHSLGIIHRDLKCDNVFVDSDGRRIVLGDLGLSVSKHGQSRMSIVGTPHWMAPELYQERYTESVDIWSFGMCVLELITNSIPFAECKNAVALYTKVMVQGAKPQSLSTLRDPYTRDFIRICIDYEAPRRPTASELLQHPFLLQRIPRDHTLCHQLIATPHPKTLKKEKKASLAVPAATTKTKTTSRSQRRGRSKSEVKVHGVTAKRECITTIKLQIYSQHQQPITVTFDFNTKVDRAEAVSAEMVRELHLPQRYQPKVERAIAAAIDSENQNGNGRTQIIGRSMRSTKDPFKSTTKSGAKSDSKSTTKNTADSATNSTLKSAAQCTSTATDSVSSYAPSQREGVSAPSAPPPTPNSVEQKRGSQCPRCWNICRKKID